MNSPEPQRMLLHYRLLDRLDSGGMGEIYRAEDTKLRRTVALKFLAPDNRDRFLRAAHMPDLIPPRCEVPGQEEADRKFVVHDQDSHARYFDRQGSLLLVANPSR